MRRKFKFGIAFAIASVALTTQRFHATQLDRSEQDAPKYKSSLPVDHPAIQYPRARAEDAADRLRRQLESGTATLTVRPDSLGVLPALLARLGINADSQMLVFSKTSFQAARISPRHPRAIYFDDDVEVAYVPGAPTLEIAAIDPEQGPIFYTMTVGSDKPVVRRGETCLRCHHGPNTAGVPGIYVGSVIPGPGGAPLRDDTAIITDHRSPFIERWGGWYVTSRRGEQPDRANAVAMNPADPSTLVRDARQNLQSLAGRFDSGAYLAGTSDIVALMTFEHQTQMTNLLTRVNWDARMLDPVARPLQGRGEGGPERPAPHENRQAGDSIPAASLDADIADLVAYLLFAGEVPLKESIEGMSTFTRTFPDRGPKDRRGRSLRDFDLHTRLFRYPLSYLIYSASFDALPASVKERVYRGLYDVLSGADKDRAYDRLTVEDRRAILEIVRDTKAGLPDYWARSR